MTAWKESLPSPLYARFTPDDRFLVILSIALAGVLLLGMLRREPRGVATIGFESLVILVLYGVSVADLFV